MSWKTSGKLLSGPPTSSNTNKLDSRFRPNLGGLNAFQREQQLVSRYGGHEYSKEERKSDWDVLRENHRFIRDDEDPGEVSWEERLARAYESKLFKEFALIDLKHYKSRKIALKWRTAEEVVDGIGEDTCASLRCKYHQPANASTSPRDNRNMWEDSTPGPSVSERGYGERKRIRRMPELRSFELPFVYEEAGERKEALVKVRLCPRCQAKLTWKPEKSEVGSEDEDLDRERERRHSRKYRDRLDEGERRRHRRDYADTSRAPHGRRSRSRSRTRSPRRRSP